MSRADKSPAVASLEYAGWTALATLARRLPLGLALRLAELLGAAVFALYPRYRRIALANLAAAFPEKDEAERRAIGARSFGNLGKNVVEFCRLRDWSPETIRARVRIEGVERIRAALAGGKGALALTAHYGDWELLPHAFAILERPLSFIVRPVDNPLLDRWFADLRTLAGNRPIGRGDAGREALRLLRREGEMVGILADQYTAADESVLVDFFGMPTRATKGLALLAVRTGAPIVPIVIARRGRGADHTILVLPPVRWERSGDVEKEIAAATQACQAALEGLIRERPDHWLWGHRRWKNVPAVNARYPARKPRRRGPPEAPSGPAPSSNEAARA